MNNKDIRLLTDIIRQRYSHIKKPEDCHMVLKYEFHIEVPLDKLKKLPSTKQTLFRNVITGKQTLAKELRYKSNDHK